jgi:hypothetical protein
MDDVIAGILMFAIGALFCFRGYLAMRIVLPIWGLFAGFAFGAGLVAAITGDGFVGTVLGWVMGAVFAIVFALLAYLFYEIAVVISLGFVGFVIAGAIVTALGIDASWFVSAVGLAAGILVGIAVIVFDLPMMLLVVLTAIAGAAAMVGGTLLVFNVIDLEELDDTRITSHFDGRPIWTIVWLVLAAAGLVAQVRWIGRVEQNIAAQWEAAGGRRLAT